jgi:putative ABC transport system ATP-binding protein
MTQDLSRLTIDRSGPGPLATVVGCLSKLLVLAAILGVLVIAWSEADRRNAIPWKAQPEDEASVPTTVTTIPSVKPSAPRGPRPLMAPVIGYVLAARKASIGFARSGKVKEVFVELGKTVEKGDVVARLEDAVPRAELDRAQATLDDAEHELARREKLTQGGVGSELERDTQRARVNVAKADVVLARESLAQCELTAPFRGVVTQKHVEVGETVGLFVAGAPGSAPSGAVVTITDLSAPEIEADVPESHVEDLAPEQPATIELDALSGVQLKGTLRLILPTADRRKATVPVRVALTDPPPHLRPDMSARVTFLSTKPEDQTPLPAPETITLSPPRPKAARPIDDATRVASQIASRADGLPWFRQATLGAFGAAVTFMILGKAMRTRRVRRPPPPRAAPPRSAPTPVAPLPPPPPASPPSSPPEPRKPTPRRASFRLVKQETISDVESVDEIYVIDDEDEETQRASASGSARLAPAARRVHPLGRDGRITGEPVLVKGGTLSLGGTEVPFAVEGKTGAHVFPARGAEITIEGVPVTKAGLSLVHGMVFGLDGRPWLYLDRAPNKAERRRTFVVQVEEETPVSEKVFPGEPPPVEGNPIVSVRGLEKVFFRGKNEVRVLDGLDLDVAEGDFLALMGPSGSGKSTLLNVIAGIERPTSGTVLVAGHQIASLSDAALAEWRTQNVGFIFQFYNLVPVLTARENVELALDLTDLPASEKRQRALQALELVGLADRAEHKPRELSGGQEQRVAIARAIATDPRILVADEPTGDLDSESATAILDLLVRLNSELGKTIIMVTHDPRAAARARHVRHLEKGNLA